jgi:hypothetical protein
MPRPTETSAGTAVGAGMGALFGRPLGAGLGGLLGGMLGTSKMSLQQAVTQALADRELRFASFQRLSPLRGRLLFLDATEGYWTIEAQIDAPPQSDQELVDDTLYDALLAKLEQWQATHA